MKTPQELVALFETKCECLTYSVPRDATQSPGVMCIQPCLRCLQLREHEAEILSALRDLHNAVTTASDAKWQNERLVDEIGRLKEHLEAACVAAGFTGIVTEEELGKLIDNQDPMTGRQRHR